MSKLIGIDTESHDGVPYSIQVSISNDTAIMIFLTSTEAIDALRLQLLRLLRNGWQLVFHYAPADLPIVEGIIGTLSAGSYRDSMLEAYGFGCYGKLGLKTLARRVLGRSRLSWEETVTPYSKEVLAQWIMTGFAHAEQHWQTSTERYHKKSGKVLKPSIKVSLAQKLLCELLTYGINNNEYDLWKKLNERMPEEWMTKLSAPDVCGEVPVKGIAHCPLDVQIQYACADPDDTRRLAIRFDAMRKEFVETLNVQWEDVDN